MKYVIWTVYEKPALTRFYVINTETRRIQSAWSNYIEAKQLVDMLNKRSVA